MGVIDSDFINRRLRRVSLLKPEANLSSDNNLVKTKSFLEHHLNDSQYDQRYGVCLIQTARF